MDTTDSATFVYTTGAIVSTVLAGYLMKIFGVASMFIYFFALQFNENVIVLQFFEMVFTSGSASTHIDAGISNGG